MMIIKPCLILLVFMLMACTAQHDSNEQNNTGVPTMANDNSKIPQHLLAWVEQARDDLAQRLQIEPVDILTQLAEEVAWSDGAIGCPEPGMYYTQALVPGYRLVFRVTGTQYYYHGQRDKPPFYCPTERAGQPLPDTPQSLT